MRTVLVFVYQHSFFRGSSAFSGFWHSTNKRWALSWYWKPYYSYHDQKSWTTWFILLPYQLTYHVEICLQPFSSPTACLSGRCHDCYFRLLTFQLCGKKHSDKKLICNKIGPSQKVKQHNSQMFPLVIRTAGFNQLSSIIEGLLTLCAWRSCNCVKLFLCACRFKLYIHI